MPDPAEPIPSTMPVIVAVALLDVCARPRSAGHVITRNVFTFPIKEPNTNIVAIQIVWEKL
jgi:hypothetical protein